jgi:hypothetical protein
MQGSRERLNGLSKLIALSQRVWQISLAPSRGDSQYR